jgi:hypothetical protein
MTDWVMARRLPIVQSPHPVGAGIDFGGSVRPRALTDLAEVRV